MKVQIKVSERASFVGTTGSGKTVLARHFLQRSGDRILAIDPKHMLEIPGFKMGRKLPLIKKEFRTIYRPKSDDDEEMAEMVMECYKRGNVRIYVDELATLARFFPRTTDTLENIARTGRERNISLWCATQRPRWVPLSFFTESEVWFVFLLRDPRDRAQLAGVVGEEVRDKIPMYTFHYLRPGMDTAQHMTLNLKVGKLEAYQNERVPEAG